MDETEAVDLAVDVVSACGDDPSWLCRRVVEETGNETLGTIVDWLVGRPIKIAFLLVAAWLATRIANRLVERFTNRLATSAGGRMAARRQPDAALSSLSAEVDLRAEQRFQTVGSVLKNVASVVIWALFLLSVASELGVALGPLLAGAGVVGIAIGLGAQGLVRDVVGGLFILVEDQYGVGDVIEAAGHSGVVEKVSLRSTRLRDVEGAVWHVPNGEARVVGNKSKGWSRALVDVTVPYGTDLDRATRAIMSIGRDLRDGQPVGHDVLSEPSVWGIEELGEHGVVLRVAVDTRPGSQATVRRELRRAVKDALEGADIPLATAAGAAPGPESAAESTDGASAAPGPESAAESRDGASPAPAPAPTPATPVAGRAGSRGVIPTIPAAPTTPAAAASGGSAPAAPTTPAAPTAPAAGTSGGSGTAAPTGEGRDSATPSPLASGPSPSPSPPPSRFAPPGGPGTNGPDRPVVPADDEQP